MNKAGIAAIITGILAAGAAAKQYLIPKAPPPGWARSKPVVKQLHPSIQPLALRLLQRAQTNGIPLIVTSGLRTNAEQERLYAQGRTTAGPIVTKARPGTSWHNYGLAFDVAVLKNGKPSWPNDRVLWHRIGEIGRSVGLRWGGDFGDLPHFEYHPDMRIADAVAGRRPPVA